MEDRAITSPNGSSESSKLILLVTGAHLRAEAADRPLAYELARAIDATLSKREDGPEGCRSIVCSDLWYLNTSELRELPTVCVGSPGVNALSAYLVERLPAVFTVDGQYSVLLDLEGSAPVACCWGADEVSTSACVRVFATKYLGEFLEAAVRGFEQA